MLHWPIAGQLQFTALGEFVVVRGQQPLLNQSCLSLQASYIDIVLFYFSQRWRRAQGGCIMRWDNAIILVIITVRLLKPISWLQDGIWLPTTTGFHGDQVRTARCKGREALETGKGKIISLALCSPCYCVIYTASHLEGCTALADSHVLRFPKLIYLCCRSISWSNYASLSRLDCIQKV